MMNTKVFYIAFFGLLLLGITVIVNGQNKCTEMNNEKEIEIEISETDFNLKLENDIIIMKSDGALKTQDYIDMVRIYNTLEIRNLVSKQAAYKEFIKLFTTKYLELSAKELEATLTKGMCYYSQKHDLYIGGKPHNNSMYKITQK